MWRSLHGHHLDSFCAPWGQCFWPGRRFVATLSLHLLLFLKQPLRPCIYTDQCCTSAIWLHIKCSIPLVWSDHPFSLEISPLLSVLHSSVPLHTAGCCRSPALVVPETFSEGPSAPPASRPEAQRENGQVFAASAESFVNLCERWAFWENLVPSMNSEDIEKYPHRWVRDSLPALLPAAGTLGLLEFLPQRWKLALGRHRQGKNK